MATKIDPWRHRSPPKIALEGHFANLFGFSLIFGRPGLDFGSRGVDFGSPGVDFGTPKASILLVLFSIPQAIKFVAIGSIIPT